ncbi:MAG: MerR family transcriptional regulator [Ignavibacteriae bacterium]|nr:MAG: MerR family transcriptional regulator [Ignavibacteriota bacterium]
MKNFSMKKLYYSISEVSRITDLEQYVLRYWETEFEQLKPAKNSSGNRIYTNKDIKLILLIKKLLKEEKYTIEGAKKILKNFNVNGEEVKENAEMNVVEVTKPKQGELSLFNDAPAQTDVNGSVETVDNKIVEDLKEIRKFLEELYNQLEEN